VDLRLRFKDICINRLTQGQKGRGHFWTNDSLRGPWKHPALQARLTIGFGGGQKFVIGRRAVDNENSGGPVKQLKGFRKIELKAGETREVAFTLTSDDLKFYDGEMKYTVEPGEFSVFVGGNSRDVLEKRFVLEGQ
jgi:hypothetical protein